MMSVSTASAHSNIALVKYWGKADEVENLPAVSSLSLTLDGLTTTTTVRVDPALTRDQFELDGKPAAETALLRVENFLGSVRRLAGKSDKASVQSVNHFPTASGLASSASGFAALALSASSAYGLSLDRTELSALSRLGSASAARSIFGGFVCLEAGKSSAEPLLPGTEWPLKMLVVIVTLGEKSQSSRSGMLHTQRTSPFYSAWVRESTHLYTQARQAVLDHDLSALGDAMQASTLMMHSTMLAARPSLRYFSPTTWAVVERVEQLRSAGHAAYFTMDAGPHVKVLTQPEQAAQLSESLSRVPGVQRVLCCSAGGDASLHTGLDTGNGSS